MRVVLAVMMGLMLTGTRAVGQTPAPSANPVSDALRNAWNSAKRNIRESAEQMPEAKYNFKATDAVKSFGEILGHVAGASYDYCSAAKGEAAPFDEDHFEKTAKTKADIQKAVNDAIAYCDQVYSGLTDQAVAALVSRPGASRQNPRAASLIGNISHTAEHYGNLVTYFRLNGMVPPSTARTMK